MTALPTPDEIAAAQAAVNAKPADAELIAVTDHDRQDGSGHVIRVGELGWHSFGQPRYDGPPDTSSRTYRAEHWLCRDCARRKGWEQSTRIASIEEHNGEVAPESLEVLIDRLGLVLSDLLAVNRHMLVQLRTIAERQGSASSVKLEQNSKSINVTTHAYSQDDISEAGDAALDELGRMILAVRERQTADWQATLEQLRPERIAEAVGDS